MKAKGLPVEAKPAKPRSGLVEVSVELRQVWLRKWKNNILYTVMYMYSD